MCKRLLFIVIAGIIWLVPSIARAQVKTPSMISIQKELVQLGYLPVDSDMKLKYDSDTLSSLWVPGTYNVITKGAIMTFQEVNQLVPDGIIGPKTLNALANHPKANPYGYNYILVSEQSPEKLYVYHNGQLVFTSLANTGIDNSTEIGTFPVYERFLTQTMQGTDFNGQHYSDPGVPYVNYFYGGDAIHGFIRSSYGWPQSLGCVELPVQNAEVVWNYIHYGTLVTVT